MGSRTLLSVGRHLSRHSGQGLSWVPVQLRTRPRRTRSQSTAVCLHCILYEWRLLELSRELGRRIAISTAEPRTFTFLMRRVSVAVQRGATVCVTDTAAVKHQTGQWSCLTVVFTELHAMQTRSSEENSVCLSVCPSVKRVDCDKTKERSVQIFIPPETSFSLVFWEEEWIVGGRRPLLPEILGQPAPGLLVYYYDCCRFRFMTSFSILFSFFTFWYCIF